MNKEVIIFSGGTSQLTQYFVKFLQDKYKDRYNIIVTLRKKEDVLNKFIFDKHLVTFETCELCGSHKLINKYRPNYFFNFAAFTNPSKSNQYEDLCWDSNYEAVKRQLCAITEYSKHTRYINCGSSHEIDGSENDYASSKISANRTVKYFRTRNNIFAIQPILFNFTSKLQSTTYIFPKLIQECLRVKNELLTTGEVKNKIKVGNIDINKYFCYIDDVVLGIWAAANQEDYLFKSFLNNGVFQGNRATIREIINLIFRELGISGDFIEENSNLIRKEKSYHLYHIGHFGWYPLDNLENIVKKMLTS